MQQNSLLQSNELRNCLQDESKIPLIRAFARYLAAYFLDLPLINVNHTLDGNNSSRTKIFLGNETSNLFLWSSRNNHFDETNRTHRSTLAADLPPEYSPALVVHLFCRCDCWLEAILFLDHFNDFRSQLIFRHLYDQRSNFSLFIEHCRSCLIDGLLQTIQEFRAESAQDLHRMSKTIESYVDIAVQIDVVFGSALVECLKNRTMELLDEELLNLINSEVDESVQLPRPPLYSMPSDCSAEIPEIIIWNRCHYLFKTLIFCFNQTNQLQPLIAHISTWLGNVSPSFIQDYSMFLVENSDSDNLAENDLVIFETVILWVVQMTLRDKSSLAQRRIRRVAHLEEISEECDIINEELSKTKRKLGALMIDSYTEDSWQNRQNLQRWVEEMADESDIEVIRTVINFLLESNPRTEMYLPPLNEKSRHKWKNVIMAQVDMSKTRRVQSDACGVSTFFPETNNCKLMIDTDKWLELQFVLQRLPFIELTDPTLIQISVAIQPSDFAKLEENERTAHVTFEEEKELNQDAATNRHSPNRDLFRDIRSTIGRISQIGVAKNGKNVIHSHSETLNEMLQDYRLKKLQKEIEKERRFLETATLNSEIDDGKSSSIENMNFAGMKYRLRLMEEKFRTNKKHRMNHETNYASPSGSSRQSDNRSQSSSGFPEEVKVMMLEKEIANITKELAELRQEVQIQQTENGSVSSTRRSFSGHNSPISKSKSKTKTTQSKKESAQKNTVSDKKDEPHPDDQSEKLSAKSKPSTGYYSSEAQEFPTTPATLPSSWGDPKKDYSMFLVENSDSDNLAENDLVIFETVILWVVQMTLRDKSSLAQRRIRRVAHLEEISEECDIINEELSKTKRKLGALMIDSYTEDSWQNRQNLQRWVEEMADESDIEVIRTVINFLLESNPRTEMYLPPLNEKSRHKWKNVIMAQVDMSKTRRVQSDACGVSTFFPETNNCKLMIDTDKWLELQFVLQRLPFIELTDPTLIQISVAIQPSDFAKLEENERTAHVTFEEEKELNQDAATNRHSPNRDLFRDIRSTIGRISQIGVAKNGKNVIHSHSETLNEMLQDYRLKKLQKEIEKERRFLETATLNSEIDDGKSSSIENMNFAGMKYRLRLMEEKFRTNKKHRMNHETNYASPSGSSRQSDNRSQSSSGFPEEVKVMMLEKEIANITKELAELRQEVQIQQTENGSVSSTRRSFSGHNSPISKSKSKTKTTQSKKESAQKNTVSDKKDEPHPDDQSEKLSAKSKPSTGYYSSEAQEFPTTPATLPSSLTSLSDDDAMQKLKVHKNKSKKKTSSLTPNEKSTPDGAFHLDFTDLNSSPERRRKTKMHKEWHDLEIYPRESRSGESGKLIVANSLEPEKSKKSADFSKLIHRKEDVNKYPKWVRLLPLNNEKSKSHKKKARSSRFINENKLLRLTGERGRILTDRTGKASSQDRQSKSARLPSDQPQSPPNGDMPRYDSGFIDQKELSVSNAIIGDHAADEPRDLNVQSTNPIKEQDGTPIFSFDISQSRAQELLNLYHSQINRSNE